MKVLGLDLSLTSTGISDGRWAETIRPPASVCPPQGKGGPARHSYILQALEEYVTSADFVAVEAPAYGAGAQGGHEELAGLRQMAILLLWRYGIPYALVPPTVRAMYVTGKGNATKEEVALAVESLYGVELDHRKNRRYDEADAAALAAYARDWLGIPLAPACAGWTASRQRKRVQLWPGEWPNEVAAERLHLQARALRINNRELKVPHQRNAP